LWGLKLLTNIFGL